MNVGDIILIRKGDPSAALLKGWIRDMDKYDGQTTTITFIAAPNYFRLNIDGSGFIWHKDFLTVVGEVITAGSTATTTKSEGCKCCKCGEFVPYVEKSDTFACYTCRHR